MVMTYSPKNFDLGSLALNRAVVVKHLFLPRDIVSFVVVSCEHAHTTQSQCCCILTLKTLVWGS